MERGGVLNAYRPGDLDRALTAEETLRLREGGQLGWDHTAHTGSQPGPGPLPTSGVPSPSAREEAAPLPQPALFWLAMVALGWHHSPGAG